MVTNEHMIFEESWYKIEKNLYHKEENNFIHQGYPNHKCRGNDGPWVNKVKINAEKKGLTYKLPTMQPNGCLLYTSRCV